MSKSLLYVINDMDWFWSHRLPLAIGARDDGWGVHVCAIGAAADEGLKATGFKGIDLPKAGGGLGAIQLLKIIITLRSVIKSKKPDLIHAITLKYAFITGLAALGTNTKIVHTLAGLGYLFCGEGAKPRILRALIGPFLKLALKGKSTQLIFQNPDDMQVMLKRGFADPNRSHLIKGSGVDCKEFTVSPEPENNPPLIVMPTRLVHEKGIAVFIEAAKILKERGIKARFEIAGGEALTNPRGIKANEMNAMITASGNAVTWLGKVSDMPDLLRRANLIAYPSYYGEGIPKVLLEAAASGRAIITTDHAGCREAVNDGQNGLLIPIKDASACAAAIQSLLTDPTRRAEMGKASRTRAETEFDVSIIVEKTLNVYSV
ncbi:MAG: glycosyltransferase family 4 protein [Alphaproteobacteria bacterium]